MTRTAGCMAVRALVTLFLLLPTPVSAQSGNVAGQATRTMTQADRLEQRILELEKANQEAIHEQKLLRERIEELEGEKRAPENAAGGDRLEQRVTDLERSKVAHEDATRTIIRESLSTLGSRINEFVTLGGTIEVSTEWFETFGDPREGSRGRSDRDIRLNTAELDFEIQVNEWTLGSLILAYDDGKDAVFRSVDENDLSIDRINVDTATITFGDTQRFWAFGSLGRMVVPFGISTGAAVGDVLTLSDPLTVEAFETKEDAILLGVAFPTPPVTPMRPVPSPPPVKPRLVRPLLSKLSQNLGYRPFPTPPPKRTYITPPPTPAPFSAAIYSYSGDTRSRLSSKSWRRDKHFGATVGYQTKLNCRPYESGQFDSRLGWLRVFCPAAFDIDVDFNNSVFESRFLESEYRRFLHQIGFVAGMAASAKTSFGPLSLIAEWNGALEHADFIDDDFVRVQKKPSAWQLTAAYQFDWNPGVETIGTQGTYVALGYSESRDLEGVTRVTGLVNRSRAGFVPRKRYLLTVGEWVTDGVRLGIEYSHNVDYPRSKGGTGKSVDAFITMFTYEW